MIIQIILIIMLTIMNILLLLLLIIMILIMIMIIVIIIMIIIIHMNIQIMIIQIVISQTPHPGLRELNRTDWAGEARFIRTYNIPIGISSRQMSLLWLLLVSLLLWLFDRTDRAGAEPPLAGAGEGLWYKQTSICVYIYIYTYIRTHMYSYI